MQEKFIELFKEAFEMEDQEIKMDDEFRDYDEWDSLTHLSLIAMLDEEFGIQVEDEEFKEIKTIQQLFDKISQS